MAVVETSRESWISRLGGSIRGIGVGIIMLILGFPVLFWNEGNSVRTAKALAEGEGACVPLDSIESVDPDYDGRLVHATGRAETDATLADPEFGIAVNAIRLERNVEMFQWEEESETTEKKNLGGSVTKTTTYTYHKTWSDSPIDSSDFKEAGHDNPGAFSFPEREWQAEVVRFGAFQLSESQISRIHNAQDYQPGNDYVCPVAGAQRMGGVIYIPVAEAKKPASTNDAPAEARKVAASPEIGDMRVSFRVVYPHNISVVAKQRGGTFTAYTAKNGKKVDLLADGVKDSAEMFADARSNNATITWLLRIGGFLLMFIGLSAILKPLSVIGDVVPFIGNILEVGVGIVAGAVAFILALVTIAVAWIFYRPIVGIILLAVAGFVAWKLWQRRIANR